MADDVLKLPDDTPNTGKKLDVESLTVSGQTVKRERNQVAGKADTEIADVKAAAPAANAPGLVVRSPLPATGTLSQPAQSASTGVLLAANANRRGFVIENDSQDGVADLCIAFAATASLTAYTRRLKPGQSWGEGVLYTGVISGIWTAAGSGAARVTEITQ